MLFLLRPRQAWMPYALPRDRTEQAAYDRDLNHRGLDRRAAPYAPPAPDAVTSLRELGALHQHGKLTDAEFAEAKRRILDGDS